MIDENIKTKVDEDYESKGDLFISVSREISSTLYLNQGQLNQYAILLKEHS